MSVFAAPGLYLRNPRGGVEDVVAMRSAGFRAIAINVRDHPLAAWSTVTARAAAASVTVLPWARCRTDADVRELCAGARKLGSRVIVNAEDELFGDDPDVTLACIERETRDLDAALSMLPWAGDLDLSIVKRLTIHLQLFPQENPDPLGPHMKPRDSRSHAYARGARRAEFMLGMHDLEPASFPPRQGAFWVYTADDMASRYSRWAQQSPVPLDLPYTGPLYGPSKAGGGKRSGTAKALKIACHAAGAADFPRPDRTYNAALERGLARLQRAFGIQPTGQYGRGTYELVKTLLSVQPGAGYALGAGAIALIEEDAR